MGKLTKTHGPYNICQIAGAARRWKHCGCTWRNLLRQKRSKICPTGTYWRLGWGWLMLKYLEIIDVLTMYYVNMYIYIYIFVSPLQCLECWWSKLSMYWTTYVSYMLSIPIRGDGHQSVERDLDREIRTVQIPNMGWG